ncbi:MAG: hypothetical protein ABJZ55_01555 [Fuerstiella sp.]
MDAVMLPRITLSVIMMFAMGCSDNSAEVPGRVAIDVRLTIDGQPAEDGTLILRPVAGVACPLVKLSITDGQGFLPASAGPVPGQWTASFRSEANGNLTERLEDKGRSNPIDQPNAGQFNVRESAQLSPPKSAAVTISSGDPASVVIDLLRS